MRLFGEASLSLSYKACSLIRGARQGDAQVQAVVDLLLSIVDIRGHIAPVNWNLLYKTKMRKGKKKSFSYFHM